jgi:hypothetical protein
VSTSASALQQLKNCLPMQHANQKLHDLSTMQLHVFPCCKHCPTVALKHMLLQSNTNQTWSMWCVAPCVAHV